MRGQTVYGGMQTGPASRTVNGGRRRSHRSSRDQLGEQQPLVAGFRRSLSAPKMIEPADIRQRWQLVDRYARRPAWPLFCFTLDPTPRAMCNTAEELGIKMECLPAAENPVDFLGESLGFMGMRRGK